MANIRSRVGKVQISGIIGSESSPVEIWSTSFWVAAYGSGGPGDSPDDMGTFDPSDYIDNHVVAFVNAVMGNACGSFIAKLIKCNVVGLAGGKVKQITDPTVEKQIDVNGAQQAGGATNVTAFGWRLQTTVASRGIATQGRMFLPGMQAGSYGSFDSSGHWSPPIVTAVSSVVSTAWTGLAAGNTGAGGLSYLPSVVTVPSSKNGLSGFSVNAADITTAENNVWVVRTRKNKLASGGIKTTHPSFA